MRWPLPSVLSLDQHTSGLLATLELGASAGLNPNWDRYGYVYDGDRCGAADSSVTVRGGSPPLRETLPTVAARRGVDLHPLDPTDADGTFGIEVTRFPGGETVQLGRYEQHGRWVDWCEY